MSDPPARRTRAVVVGAGVSGLTSALELARMGWQVRVWGAAIGSATTSGVAAALWFPYRVFPADRVATWAAESYRRFEHLSDEPATGVRMLPLTELFPGEAPQPGWRSELRGFRPARLDERVAGFDSGFVYEVPIISTPAYLPWLLLELESAGVTLETRRLESLAPALAEADVVIHAAGLGAVDLVGDTQMTPVRGQLAILPGVELDRAWVDDHGPHGVRYVVPRQGEVVVGGSVEEGQTQLDIDPTTTERLLNAGAELEPTLAQATNVRALAGIRPCRTAVRLELEQTPDGPVIHNYGHGGAGITLSWGCAVEVRRLAATIHPSGERGLIGPAPGVVGE